MSNIIKYFLERKTGGITLKARGAALDGGFRIEAGSTARKQPLEGLKNNPYYYKIREPEIQKLLKCGVLRDKGDSYEFSKDHLVTSQTLASVIICSQVMADWKPIEGTGIWLPSEEDTNKLEQVRKKEIKRPSVEQVDKFMAQWETLNQYVAQEEHLRTLFEKSKNDNLEKIFIKVCTLNTCYSTNIQSPAYVARRIHSIENIDRLLHKGDISLIHLIADCGDIDHKEKPRDCYSFATKYCHHHNRDAFPIYDKYVGKALWFFLEHHPFSKDDSLLQVTSYSKFHGVMKKNYAVFFRLMEEFRKKFTLESKPTEEIDKYLWLLGKKYFP